MGTLNNRNSTLFTQGLCLINDDTRVRELKMDAKFKPVKFKNDQEPPKLTVKRQRKRNTAPNAMGVSRRLGVMINKWGLGMYVERQL